MIKLIKPTSKNYSHRLFVKNKIWSQHASLDKSGLVLKNQRLIAVNDGASMVAVACVHTWQASTSRKDRVAHGLHPLSPPLCPERRLDKGLLGRVSLRAVLVGSPCVGVAAAQHPSYEKLASLASATCQHDTDTIRLCRRRQRTSWAKTRSSAKPTKSR